MTSAPGVKMTANCSATARSAGAGRGVPVRLNPYVVHPNVYDAIL